MNLVMENINLGSGDGYSNLSQPLYHTYKRRRHKVFKKWAKTYLEGFVDSFYPLKDYHMLGAIIYCDLNLTTPV